MVIWPNSTGMVPRWSPTKIVQMILIGCICRSRGQKVGFQNAIFKNLVWNYKAQSFHIWYIITSSRSSLPIFGYNNIMASPWPLTLSSGERPRALWALLFCLLMHLLFCPNILFFTTFCNTFDNVNSFKYTYTAKIWPIIRVSKYTPRIFK